MEKWDIVAVIIALVGLFGAIVAPIVKLTRAITQLTFAVETMEKDVTALTAENRAGHERIWDHQTEQDKQIADHETRIRVMEEDKL